MSAFLIASVLAATSILPAQALSPEANQNPMPPAETAPAKPSHRALVRGRLMIQVDDEVCTEIKGEDETLYVFVSSGGEFSVSTENCAEAVKTFLEAQPTPLPRA